MKYSKVSRRMFLQGTGGTLLAIPFLESLLPSVAQGAAAQPIKRFISILGNFDYGQHGNWFPTLTKPAQAFTVPGHHELNYAKLSSYMADGRASLSRIIGPEMTPFLNSLNIYRGLDHSAFFGHGSGHILGNLAATSNNRLFHPLVQVPTIDQLMARNLRLNPNKKGVLNFANRSAFGSFGLDASGKVVSYGRIGHNVASTYEHVFLKGTYPQTGDVVAPIVHPRRDLLSKVLDDYKRVRNGRQISSLDRVVLDNALDKLSDVHRGLQDEIREVGPNCFHKSLDKTMDSQWYRSTLTMKNYANIMIAAILCDTSRFATFSGQILEAYDTTPEPNIDFHQGISHNPAGVVGGKLNAEYMGDIQGELMRNFVAPLLKGLDGAIDPANGKSVLYNSLVHFGLENSNVHGHLSMPTMIAGNAGGALKTGYFMDYLNWTKGGQFGIPYNRILVTMLQAMGMTPAEYERKDTNKLWVNRTDSLFGAQNNGISKVGGYGHFSTDTPEVDPNRYYNAFKQYDLHYFKDPVPMPSA